MKNFPVAARLKPTPPGRTLPFEPAAARAKTADSASSRNIFHFLFVAAHPYEISYAFSCSPTVTGKITVPVVEGELPLLLIYCRLRLRLRK